MLLQCLQGGGAERIAGKWRVTLGKLALAVSRMVALEDTLLPMQNPGLNVEGSGSISFHELPGIPLVNVIVGCKPDGPPALAHFVVATKAGEVVQNGSPQTPTPLQWDFTVPANIYDLSTSFPGGQYRNKVQEIWALPPMVWEDV